MEISHSVQQILNVYIGGIAAIITILTAVFAARRWIEKKFMSKPFDRLVTSDFAYRDVLAGIEKLVHLARAFGPDQIVAINRGGAIVGGMLGKDLGLIPRVMEVRMPDNEVWFDQTIDIQNHKILLVDDRLTDGEHMKAGWEYLNSRAKDVRKFVFVYIEGPRNQICPDQYAYKAKSEHILLPWEPSGGARPINFSDRKV